MCSLGINKRALLLLTAFVATMSATSAFAQWGGWGSQQQFGPPGPWIGPPFLEGAYGFTGSAACLIAPGSSATAPAPGNKTPLPNSGFKANLQPNDATPTSTTDAFSNSFTVEGIRTFYRNGTGTVKGTSVGITVRPTPGPAGYPSFPPSADSENFSYSFKYTVQGDGSWSSTMIPGSYQGTFVAGPRTGQTDTVDAIPPIVGLISQDGNTLTGAHAAPAVETITFSNGDVWPRICHRSRIYINLPGFNPPPF
jgi:hypothetical protein